MIKPYETIVNKVISHIKCASSQRKPSSCSPSTAVTCMGPAIRGVEIAPEATCGAGSNGSWVKRHSYGWMVG